MDIDQNAKPKKRTVVKKTGKKVIPKAHVSVQEPESSPVQELVSAPDSESVTAPDSEYVPVSPETPTANVEAKPTRTRKVAVESILKVCHVDDPDVLEIGVDEAGRGPLFGRVYAAAVVLPRDFDCSMVKDSKKYTSQKKIEAAAAYIQEHAIAWHVWYEDEKKIDEINILQATQLAMHSAIHEVQRKCEHVPHTSFHLLIDGNYFNPMIVYDKVKQKISQIPHLTVEKGDNTYASIAAASILAKVHRDQYIADLCAEHPELNEHYSILSNKGYGAKKHMDGLKEHGVTQWHRLSFAPCRKYCTTTRTSK